MIKLCTALAFIVLSSQAHATCGERDVLVRLLEERYQERSVESGLGTGGNLIELFASERGETWTLVTVDPRGIACVIAVGNDWQVIGIPGDEA